MNVIAIANHLYMNNTMNIATKQQSKENVCSRWWDLTYSENH